jgi:ComF family protein
MLQHLRTSRLTDNIGVRRIARALFDLIAPPTTMDGRQPCQSSGLSAAAWSRILFVETPVCDLCGLPQPYDEGRGAMLCAACLSRPPPFRRLRAAALYDEHSRDLILQLKHADQPELGALFARWLSRAGAEVLVDADLVAPVPLHWTRLLSRRYNQAAEIARPLAALAGVAFAPDVLRRRRATQSQGHASARTRKANVQGAFAVPDSARARISGARIVLVDDVFTTGATVRACVRTLLSAGAKSVDVLVVARVYARSELSI